MSLAQKLFLLVGLAVLITLAPFSNRLVVGQEETTTLAKQEAAETAEADEVDPFTLPDSDDPDELVEFLKSLQVEIMKARRDIPKKRDRPSIMEYRQKVIQCMVKSAKPTWQAADKILGNADATEAQKTLAAKAKLGALSLLSNFKNMEAAEAMKALPSELAKLGLNDLARTAESMLLQIEIRKTLAGAPDAKSLDEMVEVIKQNVAGKPDRNSLSLIRMIISGVEKEESVEKAVALCGEFAGLFAKSDAEGAAKMAEKIEGYSRRMQLMGNSMEIEGTLIDGKKLNWNDYKGKVVLVQFWATWCGPCRAEIPNVKKYYDLYHDRGFDVVSISLDKSPEAIDAYLEKEGNALPWPVVFEKGEENAGFDQPMAIRYAVSGIPTLILLDQDGKVVSEQARGPNLGAELEKLLGPAEKEKSEGEKTSL
ncbi:MAG: TlpA family protein disulfide reductase [Pirellulales bacterium]|nr:TlpA family protein disulfide reductase [Pirellulales bacterium]